MARMLALSALAVACLHPGGAGAAVIPPANLTYATNPATYTAGKAITPDKPSSTGGAPTGYTVSPALPAGLLLNAATGVVSGTPTKVVARATYTVRASNSGGSTTVGLQITVNAIPPANLAYATNPAIYVAGSAIAPNTPSHTGGAPTKYVVSPALPAGLALNAATGVISGTPTAIVAAANHTVTASNSGGSTTVKLSIEVDAPALPAIAYSSAAYTFATGAALVPLLAISSGGAVQRWSVSPALPAGLSFNTTNGTISGTPAAVTAAANHTVTATNLAGTGTAVLAITVIAGPTGVFVSSGDLVDQRFEHTATLLTDNKVLIACGANDLLLNSTEIFDPATGVSTPAGDAFSPRFFHTASLLQSGDVLIAGGVYHSTPAGQPGDAVLYQHSTGNFAATAGSLHFARSSHTSTLLAGGKVLIAGGYLAVNLSSAELYDPATGSFTLTGSLNRARSSATATLLPNGKVLVVGGGDPNASTTLASAELYDPAAGTFQTTGSMATPRAGHTATLLTSGKVLIAGGYDEANNLAYATAEIYDPATGTFSPVALPMATARSAHTATLLADGKVLIAAGRATGNGNPLSSAELYDPTTGKFSATGALVNERYAHTATLLPGGAVLLTGGLDGNATLARTELYLP